MTANINPETGIAYGYIAANALDQDVVTELMYGDAAINLTADEAFKEWESDFEREHDREPDDGDKMSFWDGYEDYEPIIEGTYEGVKYRSSWLGGALNFFIFESPHITEKAGRASPCVPNAGILDDLDGDVQAYDVPPDWRASE